jgi:hypothetical protein
MKIQAEAAASHNRVALDRMLIDQLPEIVKQAAQGLAGANLTVLNGATGISEVATGLVGQGLAIFDSLRGGLDGHRPDTEAETEQRAELTGPAAGWDRADLPAFGQAKTPLRHELDWPTTGFTTAEPVVEEVFGQWSWRERGDIGGLGMALHIDWLRWSRGNDSRWQDVDRLQRSTGPMDGNPHQAQLIWITTLTHQDRVCQS